MRRGRRSKAALLLLSFGFVVDFATLVYGEVTTEQCLILFVLMLFVIAFILYVLKNYFYKQPLLKNKRVVFRWR